jgi:hypothetical protein
MLNDRKIQYNASYNGPGERKKKVDLIDDFGRDEDHVDETGDELSE